MKNLIFSLIVAVLAASCQKSTSLDNGSPELTRFTKEFISLKNQDELTVAYSLLTSKEKQSLWEAKLSSILNNASIPITIEQTKIIQYLEHILHSVGIEVLLKNPSIGKNIIENNISQWQKHFSNSQLNYLIQSPAFDPNFSLGSDETMEPPPDEDQEESDDGSGGGGSLINCKCIYDIGCAYPNLCMKGTSYPCKKVTGCGLFGTSNCTGLCA